MLNKSGQAMPTRAGGAKKIGRGAGARLRNAVPTANLRTLLDIVAEKGVAAASVLQGTGLTPAMLADTELRVSARIAARVVANAQWLSGDAGLAMEFGLRTPPTAHGYLGYAAMACGTLQEAVELVARYMHLRQQDVSLTLSVQGDQMVLEAADAHDTGAARRFIYEAMMIAIWRIAAFLLGEDRPEAEIWFDWPEPDYHARFRSRLPKVRYGMPAIQLRLHARYLTRRLVMAEPEAVKRAVAECEREMALMGARPVSLKARVRAELRCGRDGYPDLEAVARRLFMSSRSLKRKLERIGTHFQALLDEVRYRDAQRLLENPDLDIQRIASALGYTDPPSFTRAFKRWSGKTPSAARSQRQ